MKRIVEHSRRSLRLYVGLVFVSVLSSSCVTIPTWPIADRSQWLDLSSTFFGRQRIDWRVPPCATRTIFGGHTPVITAYESCQGRTWAFVWWAGYDVNSWDYTMFTLHIGVEKLTYSYADATHFSELVQDLVESWERGWTEHHTRDTQEFASGKWLHFVVFESDKKTLNREMFITLLDGGHYLKVTAEFWKEAQMQPGWLESRRAMVLDVVKSVRITDIEKEKTPNVPPNRTVPSSVGWIWQRQDWPNNGMFRSSS